MDTDFILVEKFISSHPIEAALTIDGLPEKEIAAVLDEFPAEILVGIVTVINRYKIAKCLKLVKPAKAFSLMEEMEVQASELILRQCDEDLRNNILSNISTKRSSTLRQKLKYNAFTIGSLMNPLVFSFKREQTVKEAITKVKQERKRLITIFPVVNTEGNPEGMVKIQDLFLAEKKSLIESIMITEIPKFSADTLIESVVNHPGWLEAQSVYVTDRFNKLIGVLDFETVQKHKIISGTEHLNLTAETASSLGELYRVGLTGLLHSINKKP